MTAAAIAVMTALSVAAGTQPATAAPAPAPAPTAAPAEPSNAASWDQVERTTTTVTTTTTTSVPPPVVTPTPSPTPVPPPPPRHRDPASSALIGTGAGLLGLGFVSLIFIAAPSALVKRVALRRADDEESLAFSSRETRYRRARNADDVMEGAFWAGISGIVIGTVLLTTGAVLKNRAERHPRAAYRNGRQVVRLDGGAGGLRLRF
jgi:hypothetical protein